MNIQILQLKEGAEKAKGLAVIIDVFRAFSLEAYLMSWGAERIYPVGDEALARDMKKTNPQFILAGERGGKILPGFDTGNSPYQAKNINVAGKTIVHTTSAGTQGIASASGADIILGASLVNAKATADYIKNSGADDVSLVCMGLAGTSQTEEDTLCAEYIKSILLGYDIDMKSAIESLKTTSGAKFFDKSKSEVFPENDFHMCTEVDKFDFVLRLNKSSEHPYMEKISLSDDVK